MLKLDEAFEIMMGSARRLGSEHVEINSSLNRILAEDVVSEMEMPPFNKSLRDGFACRRADLSNELTIIETIRAGYVPQKAIEPGQCAKIMTGAILPEGADCVVMKEYVDKPTGDTVRFVGEEIADNICLKGEDIKKGDIVLRAGCKIAPQHIAVMASHGCVEPLVSLRPRVGVIATGDELVEPSEKPAAGQIRNSNGYQLVAQLRSVGATATNHGIAADTKKAQNDVVQKAIAENDVVLLSGGVSVGDYDFVREILRANKIKLLFEKIAVKPGRPMVFGVSDEVFCFGLPGNPVSTFVMFELLVKPFLYKMAGHKFEPIVNYRQLTKTITKGKTERDSWLPVVFVEEGKAAKIKYHGSGHINSLCEADGLICIPAGVAEVKEGTRVAVRQI